MSDEAKIGLLGMILWAEGELERIDVWETGLRSEGKALYSQMAIDQRHLRQIVSTLELLREHEKEFVSLVRARRRANEVVAPRSTARLSPASTPTNAPPENTAQSIER